MAFAVKLAARLPLDPPEDGVHMTTPQTSLDVADWPVACPLAGTLLLRFDGGISADAGSRATRDPGVSPDRTRTGWLTKLVARLHPDHLLHDKDARAAGRTSTTV